MALPLPRWRCGTLQGDQQGQRLAMHQHQSKWWSSVRLRYRPALSGPTDTTISNLGQLSGAASSGAEDLSWAVQRVSPESFASRGLYVDPVIMFSSGFLLILLLALSFQRILGLDRIIAQFMLNLGIVYAWCTAHRQQQEKRRQNTRDAKQQLERTWLQEGKGSEEQDAD